MSRTKGQTSEQRGDKKGTIENETIKDVAISRLTELVETQARQLERLMERAKRCGEQ
ncbi:hypothetical protein PanWU01x14_021340, partial [Parasponia andersonii]